MRRSATRRGVARLRQSRRPDGRAGGSYRQALGIRESLAARGGNGLKLQRDLAGNYERIGDELLIGGEPGKALENYRKEYGLRGKMPQEDRDARRGLATSCQRMVQALVQTGQLKEARELQRRALELSRGARIERPGDAGAQRDRFISYVKARHDVLVAGSDKAGALRAITARLCRLRRRLRRWLRDPAARAA